MERISVRVKQKKSPINVSSRSGIIMARKLADLMDVDTSNVQDNFIMMYDSETKKYKFYDPSSIFTTASQLPQDFIDYLNRVLNPDALIAAIRDLYAYIDSLTLGRLANVKSSVDNASDTFLIRYDEVAQKYEAVNPDEILSSALDDNNLPQDFIDYLNDVLIPEKLDTAIKQLRGRIDTLKIGDLANVNDYDKLKNYILMFNGNTYSAVNVDEVLIASVQDDEPGYVGLPSVFLDQLDTDLDDRIDSDAGFF